MAFKIARRVEGIHTPIYCFNGGLSDGRLLSSAEELHTYMDGWRECAELFDKTFTEDELKAIYPQAREKAVQYFLDIIASKCAQSAADDPSLFEPLFGALEETADKVLIREALLRAAKYGNEDALAAAIKLEAKKRTRQPVSVMLDRQCNLQCPYCCQGNDREVKGRYTDDEVYRRFDAAMTKLETLAGDALYPQIVRQRIFCDCGI